MLCRSLAALAALTLASAGAASAQSVYLAPGSVYVAPGATVYVTPPPANGVYNGAYYNGGTGAPGVVYAPGYQGPVYSAPPPVVAAPLPAPAIAPPYAPNGEVYRPPTYGAPAPGYAPPPQYEEPLSAYGAAPRAYLRAPAYVRERVIVAPFDEAPRPPAPVPYGAWRLR